MMSERKGIAVVGNVLTDYVKTVDAYPGKGMLSSITDVSCAVGGCVSNVGMDLKAMDATLPVYAVGMAGNDEGGEFLRGEYKKAGLNVSGLCRSNTLGTSFSDVMTVADTGERTFFHYRGSNAAFSPKDIDLDKLPVKMLHFGYILLMDAFDAPSEKGGTVLADFLAKAQKRGIKTSVDVVSDSLGRYREKVVPALRFCDNVILNEIEACGTAGLPPRDGEGRLITKNIRRTLAFFIEQGVRERVIIHCPEMGFCLDKAGKYTEVPSLSLPYGYIKGTVGAGDAFCAGALYGIYNGWTDREILRFAAGSAACNLSAMDSVGGRRSRAEIYDVIKKYEVEI